MRFESSCFVKVLVQNHKLIDCMELSPAVHTKIMEGQLPNYHITCINCDWSKLEMLMLYYTFSCNCFAYFLTQKYERDLLTMSMLTSAVILALISQQRVLEDPLQSIACLIRQGDI